MKYICKRKQMKLSRKECSFDCYCDTPHVLGSNCYDEERWKRHGGIRRECVCEPVGLEHLMREVIIKENNEKNSLS